MRTRKAQKLALAKERLQTLTPAELTEVSGGDGHEAPHGHRGTTTPPRPPPSPRPPPAAPAPLVLLVMGRPVKRYGVLAARPSALAARPSCPMASAVARRITGAAADRSRLGSSAPRPCASARRTCARTTPLVPARWCRGEPAAGPRGRTGRCWPWWRRALARERAGAGSGKLARGPAVVRDRVVVALLPAAFADGAPARPAAHADVSRAAPRSPSPSSATGPELTGAGAASKLLGTDMPPAGAALRDSAVVRAAGTAGAGRRGRLGRPRFRWAPSG